MAGSLTCQAQIEVPRGVFSIANSGKLPLSSVLSSPNVDGITLRQDWSGLEPTEGNFDFSFLDSAVAACAGSGKQILLRIGTQAGKPAWVNDAVTAAGGSFFSFVATDGTPMTIPVFWDPTFLAKKTAMISALGAHFTNNPSIKVVSASFANAISEDWNVPHTPTDVTNWLALGYTTDKLLAAGQQIIDTTMIAFPNQIVTMAVGGSGHVNGVNLDPTADYAARAAVGTARASWSGRFNVQKNDLSTFIPPAPGTDTLYAMIWDFQPDVAGQMVYQCANDPTYRANNGVPQDPSITLEESIDNAVSYNEKYVEIYQTDANSLPDAVAYAHTALTAATPTPTPSATPSPTPSATPTPTPTPTPPKAPSPPTGLRIVS
ncbi:MAG: beta-galactosidase [Chthoniobacterales bacterium]